jgi:hypothetical protein
MPPLVQEISELFECVIGCGHVSVAPFHTYFVCAAGNGQAIAKQSAERGPLVVVIDTAAGRYGDARTRGRSPNRAHRLLHKDCFVWSGSFRSFSLTVHRSPHTLKSRDTIYGALRSCHRAAGGVVLLFRHHGPKTTCHFVRQCNGDAHAGFALQHAYQPAVVRRSKSLNGLKNGHSLPGSACLHA